MTEDMTEAMLRQKQDEERGESVKNDEAALRSRIAELEDQLNRVLDGEGVAASAADLAPTANLLDRMKVVRWALDNFGDLKTVVGLFALYQEAQTVADKWAVIKDIGDFIVEKIGTFPTGSAFACSEVTALSEQEVSVLVEAAALRDIDWKKLVEFCTTLLPYIVEILLRVV